MSKKIFNKVKGLLRDKLGITALEKENARLNQQVNSIWKTNTSQNERIEAIRKYYDSRITNLEHISAQAKGALSKAEQLTATSERLMQHFEISADIGVRDDSWAVLCVHGSKELLYFIDMRGSDMQQVRDMLMRYAGTRQTVDAPYGYVKPIKHYREL